MKNTKTSLFALNLQLFAEGTGGGDGGTGATGATGVTATAAVSQSGEKNSSLANVKYGIQAEEASPAAEVVEDPTEDRAAKFEALIKGEYKDLYDARVQDTLQKRLKSTKDTVAKYEALSPILDVLANKHGVDASNIEALKKAIEEDDSYFEQAALEKGLTVEQYKEIRKIEQENAELRREQNEQKRQENARKLYSQWMEQAEKTRSIYPTFDFRTEMQNEQFVQLLRSNVDVRTAYEVIHKDDIISGAMQFTAKTVEQKLANKIIAGGKRPAENGNSSQGATVTKNDVSQLTKADREEIARRIARGEKISFS